MISHQPSTEDITTLDTALGWSRKEALTRYRDYVNPELVSLLSAIGVDKQMISARGVTVTDDEGTEYLDFLGGYGALNHGHNHPEILDAVERVNGRTNMLQASVETLAAGLAESLAAVTPGDLEKSFFANSGTEAVEAALKLARISTGRQKILYAEGAFHGKTFGALSAMGNPHYKDPFRPLVPEFYSVPYGDIDALEDELRSREYAAFIVEPIQGEAGINVPPDGYLSAVQEHCRDTDTLLILDEIQTGLGRTGDLFAADHEDVEPDIMTLAKSLGGGIAPIGVCIATDDVWSAGYGSRKRGLLHSSTFGGNTRACAAGLKAVEILLRDDLADRANRTGTRFREQLQDVVEDHRLFEAVRGRGLMIGLELYEPAIGKGLSREYLSAAISGLLLNEHQVITAYTLNNPNVLRFEPPLVVDDEQVDRVVEALDEIGETHRGYPSVLVDLLENVTSKRIGL